jgi:hypothetical protein
MTIRSCFILSNISFLYFTNAFSENLIQSQRSKTSLVALVLEVKFKNDNEDDEEEGKKRTRNPILLYIMKII